MGELKDSLQEFLNRVETDTLRGQREHMFALLRRLILATPQDESVCVANWFVTTDFKSVPATDNPDRDGVTAMSKGLSEIEKFRELGVLTLTNPIPYTLRIIEEGHSKQAPPGTLSAIIAQLETELFSK